MILDETAKSRHREIHIGIPESLPELIGLARKKISQRIEQINAVKAVRDGSAQPNAACKRIYYAAQGALLLCVYAVSGAAYAVARARHSPRVCAVARPAGPTVR